MTRAKNEAAATRVAIEGDFTIHRAAELKPVLLEPLLQATSLEVDLSRVTDFDGAGVQLLILLQRTAAADHIDLHLVAPSPAVQEVLALLSLDALSSVAAPARGASRSSRPGGGP